jgi:FAD synthetase
MGPIGIILFIYLSFPKYIEHLAPQSMKTVLVFGTFDLLHPGHLFLLRQARLQGDRLVVSLARDRFVRGWKGKEPRYPEQERLARVRETGLADEVRLSDPEPHSFRLLQEVRPDLICLGHDQQELAGALARWMRRNRVRIPLKRLGRLPLPPQG